MARFLAGLGWVVLYIVLAAPVFVGSAMAAHLLGQPWMSPIVHGVLWIGGILVVAWLLRVVINGEALGGIGLVAPRIGQLALGAALGCAAILMACALEAGAGWLHAAHMDVATHRGVPKLALILLGLFPSLGVGFAEEVSFRGYVYQTFAERGPPWLAAVLMSVIFALLHFSLSGFGVAFVLSVVVMSLMFLAMRLATGSLWFPIGFHAAWDWTQTYLIGLSPAAGYNPALIHIRQTGPRLWVGQGEAVESGLLFILLAALLLFATLTWCRMRCAP